MKAKKVDNLPGIDNENVATRGRHTINSNPTLSPDWNHIYI